MNILFIGDIVGRPGREAVKALLPKIVDEERIGFIVANAENVAGGSGINAKSSEELFGCGIDVLTSGDHIFKRKDAEDIINHPYILRPANLPPQTPGKGYCIVEKEGIRLGVINLQGRVFMSPIECPFRTAENIIEKIKKETDVILVDIHAEATSEKIALSFFLDGKASVIVGTHTHVQTADEKILPKGTAYITDLGMTGPCDSVIGRKKEKIIERFITGLPRRFEIADSGIELQGIVVDLDNNSRKPKSIRRVKECL